MTNLVTAASEIIAHITMKLADGSAADKTTHWEQVKTTTAKP